MASVPSDPGRAPLGAGLPRAIVAAAPTRAVARDLRAARTRGADGMERIEVRGTWGGSPGAPPATLLVEHEGRRHVIAALPCAPPDEPMDFLAAFAVPPELTDALDAGFALGLGRVELPVPAPADLREAEPALGAVRARAGIAAAAERPRWTRDVPAPVVAMLADHGWGRSPGEDDEDGGATSAGDDTVVDRAVLAERRAERSERLARDLEARALAAEQAAAEAEEQVRGLGLLLDEVSSERDRLRRELAQERAAVQAAEADRRTLASELARMRAATAPRPLPGLEEIADRLAEQEPAPAAAPAPGGAADPFADALAKLRAAAPESVVASVVPDEDAPVEAPAPAEAPASAEVPAPAEDASLPVLLHERVLSYVIAAEHPRRRWLAPALAALEQIDDHSAALLVAQLLPDQARTLRRELVYDVELSGLGALRVELHEAGGVVRLRDGASSDALFSLDATPTELAPLAAGGAPWWPRGLRGPRVRRFFLALARLSRSRRRPVTLADLVTSGLRPDPDLVVRALATAVPAAWTAGHTFAVTVSVPGHRTCRVVADDGAPLTVLRVDETGRRSSVIAGYAGARVVAGHGPRDADAVLIVPERGALAFLGQAEPPEGEDPPTALGDARAATMLLGWFDRVQGLPARS